jgi:hypothetical protein
LATQVTELVEEVDVDVDVDVMTAGSAPNARPYDSTALTVPVATA